jgi:hypothetical protein
MNTSGQRGYNSNSSATGPSSSYLNQGNTGDRFSSGSGAEKPGTGGWVGGAQRVYNRAKESANPDR